MTSRVLSSLLLALLASIALGRGQAWTARADLRDRALFAVSALDLASPPARATQGTTARELTPRNPTTPPATTPVADAEHVEAHVQRTRWPAAAERQANWRGFIEAGLTAPHDAIAPPRV